MVSKSLNNEVQGVSFERVLWEGGLDVRGVKAACNVCEVDRFHELLVIRLLHEEALFSWSVFEE